MEQIMTNKGDPVIEKAVMKVTVKMNNDIENAILQIVKAQFPPEYEYEVNAQKIAEALEKQIPKKPKRIHGKYQRKYNDLYLCPVCGKSVFTECGDKYMDYALDWCNYCGQRLDWSEE